MSSHDDLYRAILEHNLIQEDEKEKKDKNDSAEEKLSRYDVVSAVTVALALALFAIRIYIMVRGPW